MLSKDKTKGKISLWTNKHRHCEQQDKEQQQDSLQQVAGKHVHEQQQPQSRQHMWQQQQLENQRTALTMERQVSLQQPGSSLSRQKPEMPKMHGFEPLCLTFRDSNSRFKTGSGGLSHGLQGVLSQVHQHDMRSITHRERLHAGLQDLCCKLPCSN